MIYAINFHKIFTTVAHQAVHSFWIPNLQSYKLFNPLFICLSYIFTQEYNVEWYTKVNDNAM